MHLSQDEAVRLYRGLRRGESGTQMTRTPRQHYPRQTVASAEVQGYEARISDRAAGRDDTVEPQLHALQDVYVEGAGRYRPDILPGDERLLRGNPVFTPVNAQIEYPDPSDIGAVRGLRDEVEVARHEGNLPANRVAGSLVHMGFMSEAEQTVGRSAGMATGYSAEAGSEGRQNRGSDQQIEDSMAVRQGSYAVIFEALRAALHSHGEAFVSTRQARSMRSVARAFESWLLTALNGEGEIEDTDDARRAARRLEAALIRFLRQTRPQ